MIEDGLDLAPISESAVGNHQRFSLVRKAMPFEQTKLVAEHVGLGGQALTEVNDLHEPVLGAIFPGDGALDGHATTVAVGLFVVEIRGVTSQSACDIEGLASIDAADDVDLDLLLGLIAEVLEELSDLDRLLGLATIAEAAQAVTELSPSFSHPELVLRELAAAKLSGLGTTRKLALTASSIWRGVAPSQTS